MPTPNAPFTPIPSNRNSRITLDLRQKTLTTLNAAAEAEGISRREFLANFLEDFIDSQDTPEFEGEIDASQRTDCYVTKAHAHKLQLIAAKQRRTRGNYALSLIENTYGDVI